MVPEGFVVFWLHSSHNLSTPLWLQSNWLLKPLEPGRAKTSLNHVGTCQSKDLPFCCPDLVLERHLEFRQKLGHIYTMSTHTYTDSAFWLPVKKNNARFYFVHLYLRAITLRPRKAGKAWVPFAEASESSAWQDVIHCMCWMRLCPDGRSITSQSGVYTSSDFLSMRQISGHAGFQVFVVPYW